jgi:hypothetical protein
MRIAKKELRVYVHDFIIDDGKNGFGPEPETFLRTQFIGTDMIEWKTWCGISRTWHYKNGVWIKNEGTKQEEIVDTPELEIFYQKSIREEKLERIIHE